MFVFGSFLTEEFYLGSSGIDIGVYCNDFRKTNLIFKFLEEYCQSVLKVDYNISLIGLDTFSLESPNICASKYRVAEYYPKELVEHLTEVLIERRHQSEDNSEYSYLQDSLLEMEYNEIESDSIDSNVYSCRSAIEDLDYYAKKVMGSLFDAMKDNKYKERCLDSSILNLHLFIEIFCDISTEIAFKSGSIIGSTLKSQIRYYHKIGEIRLGKHAQELLIYLTGLSTVVYNRSKRNKIKENYIVNMSELGKSLVTLVTDVERTVIDNGLINYKLKQR